MPQPASGLKDHPNTVAVELSRGLVGYFRPVTCAGSCAPANLWWNANGAVYQIQMRLSPALSVVDQRRAMVAAAKSSILAGPR